jgi:hypothetical protein
MHEATIANRGVRAICSSCAAIAKHGDDPATCARCSAGKNPDGTEPPELAVGMRVRDDDGDEGTIVEIRPEDPDAEDGPVLPYVVSYEGDGGKTFTVDWLPASLTVVDPGLPSDDAGDGDAAAELVREVFQESA